MAVMSTKKYYLIVDRGGAAYVGELGHGFKAPVSIHIPIWCVMDCTVQWDVEVEILGVLLGLVHNYGRHEALTIGSGKDNLCASEWFSLSIFHLPHLFTLK